MPAQDKQYLVGFAQLPDGATLDRTEDVIRRMSDIALKTAGRRKRGRVSGPVDQRLHQRSNAGIVFATLKPFEERRDAANSAGGAIAHGAEPEVRRHPGRVHRDVPAAAGAGPRHDRRLQAADRGPRRPRLRGARRGDQGVHREGAAGAGARRRVLRLPGQRAAALCRHRPRPRRGSSASPCRTSSTRCRSISARSTSTTSTGSAAPIRCACRPTRSFARAPTTSAS